MHTVFPPETLLSSSDAVCRPREVKKKKRKKESFVEKKYFGFFFRATRFHYEKSFEILFMYTHERTDTHTH